MPALPTEPMPSVGSGHDRTSRPPWSPGPPPASAPPPPGCWPPAGPPSPWWPGGRIGSRGADDCRVGAPGRGRGPPTWPIPSEAAALAVAIWDELGPLDVIINNAGIPMRRPADRLTMDEVERVMTVNYFSPVAITLALLPRMLERGSGTIVNVSSLGGRLGIASEAAYSASKFALAGWSEALAADLVGTGVAVRLVLPGAIDTEIWDQPDNDPPDLRRAVGPGRGGGRRHRRVHRQRPVRALPPGHAGGGGDEDQGLRRLHGRHAGHGRGNAPRAPVAEPPGPTVMKALVFGARPDPEREAAGPDRRARGAAGRAPLRPARDGRRPAHPSRLGGHPAHPLRRVRLGHQAGPGRVRGRRHRQSDGRLLLAPPRPRARGGGRGGRPRARRPGASRSASGWCSTRG